MPFCPLTGDPWKLCFNAHYPRGKKPALRKDLTDSFSRSENDWCSFMHYFSCYIYTLVWDILCLIRHSNESLFVKFQASTKLNWGTWHPWSYFTDAVEVIIFRELAPFCSVRSLLPSLLFSSVSSLSFPCPSESLMIQCD